jgi:hypothetical protein
MKIAIPTNDGITITSSLEASGAFYVCTLKDGEIKKHELRKLKFSEIINFEDCFQDKVKDCQVLLFHEMDEDSNESLQQLEIRCIHTSENQIHSIVQRFLNEEMAKTTASGLMQKAVYSSK